MTTAAAAFHVSSRGQTLAFRKGDHVPAHIASTVGSHLLVGHVGVAPTDHQGLVDEVNRLQGELDAGRVHIDELTEQVHVLTEARDQLAVRVAELQAEHANEMANRAQEAAQSALDAAAQDQSGTRDEDPTGNLDDLDKGNGDSDEAPADPLFDPTEHNVKAVLDYLETADSDEFDRVIAAEKAGDNRKSITGG